MKKEDVVFGIGVFLFVSSLVAVKIGLPDLLVVSISFAGCMALFASDFIKG